MTQESETVVLARVAVDFTVGATFSASVDVPDPDLKLIAYVDVPREEVVALGFVSVLE